MHLPEIDTYAHLDSPVHRWDARARLAALGVLAYFFEVVLFFFCLLVLFFTMFYLFDIL